MKNKAIILIGAGLMQRPVIEAAKQAGLKVICTDQSEKAPLKDLADEFTCLAGDDVQGMLAFAEKVSKKDQLVGIYSGSDFGLATVAAVCEKYNLPGVTPESVQLSLNKDKAKACWQKLNLSCPKGIALQKNQSFDSAALIYPLIVKPVDSSGSRGVTFVDKPDQLDAALEEAFTFSETILIEEMIEGRHIDVNGLMMGGRFTGAGIKERFFSPKPDCVPVSGFYPSGLSQSEEESVYELLKNAAEALGITQGPIKGDVIWAEGRGPVLLEIAPRFHGEVFTAHLLKYVTGSTPIEAWFAYLAGIDPYQYWPKPVKQTAGWMALFAPHAGVLEAVNGIDSLAQELPGYQNVLLRLKPGARLDKPRDNRSVVGFLWLTAENREEAQARFDMARSQIQFVLKP